MAAPRRDHVEFRFLATPQDTAWLGSTVDAGRILEWIDRAGYACAVAWSATYCVTAYVGNINFTQPVPAGSIVEVRAQVIHTGRSSMQVLVRVGASSVNHADSEPAMDCILVFVAVDETGRPMPVPPWHPSTELQRQLEANAQARLAVREQIHAAMRAETYSDEGTVPRVTFRFLALPSVANFGGRAHGGTVMRWITEAAHTCAAGWSTAAARAVYSGGIHFYRPIHIGDVVEVDSRLIHATESTMHVSTRVHSWPTTDPSRAERTTQCLSILTDPSGAVPALDLRSEEDVRLDRHARDLVRMRSQLASIPKSLPGT